MDQGGPYLHTFSKNEAFNALRSVKLCSKCEIPRDGLHHIYGHYYCIKSVLWKNFHLSVDYSFARMVSCLLDLVVLAEVHLLCDDCAVVFLFAGLHFLRSILFQLSFNGLLWGGILFVRPYNPLLNICLCMMSPLGGLLFAGLRVPRLSLCLCN